MWEVVDLWHVMAWPYVGIHRVLNNHGGGQEESEDGWNNGNGIVTW